MSGNGRPALGFHVLFIAFVMAPLVAVSLTAFTPENYLTMPQGSLSLRWFRALLHRPDFLIESYGWTTNRIRPPVPSAARITRMDEAMSWIPLIPIDRYVLRRIVGARSLVHPITERHLYPWRRLATALGADHKAVQRWHAQGIDLIVSALNGR